MFSFVSRRGGHVVPESAIEAHGFVRFQKQGEKQAEKHADPDDDDAVDRSVCICVAAILSFLRFRYLPARV